MLDHLGLAHDLVNSEHNALHLKVRAWIIQQLLPIMVGIVLIETKNEMAVDECHYSGEQKMAWPWLELICARNCDSSRPGAAVKTLHAKLKCQSLLYHRTVPVR
jgi:hypothetical protein